MNYSWYHPPCFKKVVLFILKAKNREVLKVGWGFPIIVRQSDLLFDGFNPKCAASKMLAQV